MFSEQNIVKINGLLTLNVFPISKGRYCFRNGIRFYNTVLLHCSEDKAVATTNREFDLPVNEWCHDNLTRLIFIVTHLPSLCYTIRDYYQINPRL